MQRWDCDNIGGIHAAFVASSLEAQGAWQKLGESQAEIIVPDVFEEVPLESGQYAERMQEDDSGTFIDYEVSFFVNRDREGLGEFERKYRNKDLVVIIKDNNNSLRLFEDMRLSREGRSGQTYTDPSGRSYSFRSNGIEAARWVDPAGEPSGDEPELPPVGGQLFILGNGTAAFFTLTHTLGRQPRHLSVWRVSDGAEVVLDVRCPDASTITAEFSVPPQVGEDYVVYLS